MIVGVVILGLCIGASTVTSAQEADDAGAGLSVKEALQENPPAPAKKEVPEENLPDATAAGDISGELKEAEKVAKEIGVPPAMRMPVFTASRILSRWIWPGIISLWAWQTPIIGRLISSSV